MNIFSVGDTDEGAYKFAHENSLFMFKREIRVFNVVQFGNQRERGECQMLTL